MDSLTNVLDLLCKDILINIFVTQPLNRMRQNEKNRHKNRPCKRALKIAVGDDVAGQEILQFQQEPRPSNESLNAVGKSNADDKTSSRGNFQSRSSTNV